MGDIMEVANRLIAIREQADILMWNPAMAPA